MSSVTGNKLLLLAVDGGGTHCRARLADLTGKILGEAVTGPANIRLGLEESLAAVAGATRHCLKQAGLRGQEDKIIACLALAGACEPSTLSRAQASPLPFCRATFTSDARAACVGAHAGCDGGIIIVGTGSVGWGIAGEREFRVGGWGFPLSDEGSGAWLGYQVLRQVLRAHDGVRPWTALSRSVFEQFEADAYAIVRWMRGAGPRDYASLAPLIVAHAERGDAAGRDLLRTAAAHIDVMAARLLELGVRRLSLMGGLSDKVEYYLSEETRDRLVAPLGDALSGALELARAEALLLRSHMAADDV
jgi:glucosamine kinase